MCLIRRTTPTYPIFLTFLVPPHYLDRPNDFWSLA